MGLRITSDGSVVVDHTSLRAILRLAAAYAAEEGEPVEPGAALDRALAQAHAALADDTAPPGDAGAQQRMPGVTGGVARSVTAREVGGIATTAG